MSHAIVTCLRCGDPCFACPEGNPIARPFRKASHGLCAACIVCECFQGDADFGLGFALPSGFEPEGLRLPHLQKQFARVLAVGRSELRMEDVDWDQVIQKWGIVGPSGGRRGRPRARRAAG